MEKLGIVICSRATSRRLPGKCFKKINGKAVIEHLVDRLKKTNISVILAVPENEKHLYQHIDCAKFYGYEHDPLTRMYHAAKENKLQHVIRVTHDKVLVDHKTLLKAVNDYSRGDYDYLYSSDFTEGSAFEIISFEALKRAAQNFNNVEFISYAVKAVIDKERILKFKVPRSQVSAHRLLLDYPEDYSLLEIVFQELGNECTLEDAIRFLNRSRWAKKINKLPEVSIYTCAYNASDFIRECIFSVLSQNVFSKSEYIIIDDCSTDRTFIEATKLTYKYKNIKVIRNEENMGLSSSSNVALSHAKGRYIVRLDADDYFTKSDSVAILLESLKRSGADAIYPDNYLGSYEKIQKGNECHHVGGAMFKTRAINHIKFTERLRNYEGYDLYLRAQSQIENTYLNEPIFFYRQHDNSMSKTNLTEREITKKQIEERSSL